MMEAATAEAPARGTMAEAYHREVIAAEASDGLTRQAAFDAVAARHGTTRANVQTAFYRHARKHPDGSVKHRPGSKVGRAARAAGASPTVAPDAPAANGTAAAPRGRGGRRPASANGHGKPGDALRALAAELRKSAALLDHEATAADRQAATLASIRGVVGAA